MPRLGMQVARGALVALAAVAALGGCASKGSSTSSSEPRPAGGSTLTVDAVHTAAGKLGSTGGSCPLGLDVNAALKAAGVSGTATPDTANGPAATGETPETAGDGSPSKQYGFSLIQCGYVVTDGGTTTVLGVNLGAMAGKSTGIANLLGPVIQRDGRISVGDLKTFLSVPFRTGQTKVTSGMGTAVYAQLTGSNTGNIGLEAGTRLQPDESDGAPALSGPALEKFAMAIAAQVHM